MMIYCDPLPVHMHYDFDPPDSLPAVRHCFSLAACKKVYGVPTAYDLDVDGASVSGYSD